MSLMGKRFMHPLRLVVQWGFLAFMLYLGLLFARFVGQFASPGAMPPIARPDGIDGFLPIAALVGLRDWLLRGSLNPAHPAAVVVFLTVLTVAILLKRSFCSWICPVAAISELLWKRGFALFRRNLRPPRWLDIGLAILGVITIAYALVDLDQFIRRSTLPEPADFWLGIAAIVLLVEISRRTVGKEFTLVLVGFLLYTYLGKFIPGPLSWSMSPRPSAS